MNDDFIAGRRIQTLESQIKHLHFEINQASNKKKARSVFVPVAETAFQEYLGLAQKYHIPGYEIKQISNLYRECCEDE